MMPNPALLYEAVESVIMISKPCYCLVCFYNLQHCSSSSSLIAVCFVGAKNPYAAKISSFVKDLRKLFLQLSAACCRVPCHRTWKQPLLGGFLRTALIVASHVPGDAAALISDHPNVSTILRSRGQLLICVGVLFVSVLIYSVIKIRSLCVMYLWGFCKHKFLM